MVPQQSTGARESNVPLVAHVGRFATVVLFTTVLVGSLAMFGTYRLDRSGGGSAGTALGVAAAPQFLIQ